MKIHILWKKNNKTKTKKKQTKKFWKGEVVMHNDDFTFFKNKIVIVQYDITFEKKIKKPVRGRTTSPPMSSSSLTTWPIFAKKKLTNPFIQIQLLTDPKIQKSRHYVCRGKQFMILLKQILTRKMNMGLLIKSLNSSILWILNIARLCSSGRSFGAKSGKMIKGTCGRSAARDFRNTSYQKKRGMHLSIF